MPNRIIKESICTSESIDRLSSFQETFFYRLIVSCDDYGRMDARPRILASKLFPLKDLRENQVSDALRALTSAELVILYEVNGKPFLQMKTWDRHQRVRNSKEKYPGPPAPCAPEMTPCGNSPQFAATCGETPPESNPNPNPKREEDEDEKRAREADRPINCRHTIQPVAPDQDDGMPFGITEEDIHASLLADQQIEDAAKSYGLQTTDGAMLKARDLAHKYGLDKLLAAIPKAVDHPTWAYVRGILENNGGRNGNNHRNHQQDHPGKGKYGFLPDTSV